MWTPELVWDRIKAMAATQRALPDIEANFRTPHSGSWPKFPDEETAYGYGHFTVKVSPSMESIDQASEAWSWLGWLGLDARKTVFLLASGVPTKRIARKMRISRQKVWRVKKRSLLYISAVLNK
jgi:DNA-binding CsgD family transcriptional regulator